MENNREPRVLKTIRNEIGVTVDVCKDFTVIRFPGSQVTNRLLFPTENCLQKLLKQSGFEQDAIFGVNLRVRFEEGSVYIEKVKVISLMNDTITFIQNSPGVFSVVDSRIGQGRIATLGAQVATRDPDFIKMFGWLTENIHILVPELREIEEN